MKKITPILKNSVKNDIKYLIELTASCDILKIEEKKSILEKLADNINNRDIESLKKLLSQTNKSLMITKVRSLQKGNLL